MIDIEKNNLAYYMRRIYERGLTTSLGGNASIKLPDGTVLITASQKDKGNLSAEDICVIDPTGKHLTPHLKTSGETPIHLAIYKAKPSTRAILHAHPPTATAFSATNTPILSTLHAEGWLMLQSIAIAPYALMGTENLATYIAEAALKSNAIVMENHGVITLGDTLISALDRLEVLENAAKISLFTSLIGERRELSPSLLQEIDALK